MFLVHSTPRAICSFFCRWQIRWQHRCIGPAVAWWESPDQGSLLPPSHTLYEFIKCRYGQRSAYICARVLSLFFRNILPFICKRDSCLHDQWEGVCVFWMWGGGAESLKDNDRIYPLLLIKMVDRGSVIERFTTLAALDLLNIRCVHNFTALIYTVWTMFVPLCRIN